MRDAQTRPPRLVTDPNVLCCCDSCCVLRPGGRIAQLGTLPILCVVPNDTWVEANWSELVPAGIGRRKVCACLTSICRYDDGGVPAAISDWDAAEDECLINVDEMLTFGQLTGVLSSLVAADPALFVYSGSVPPTGSDHPVAGRTREPVQFRMCQNRPILRYAASIASGVSTLHGYEADAGPGSHFLLGRFAYDDPIADAILRKWDSWPDSRCTAMLPDGPSPSSRSVELVRIGSDADAIGLFRGGCLEEISTADLRTMLGPDAILARLDEADLMAWVESPDLSVLEPIDRDLPFQRRS